MAAALPVHSGDRDVHACADPSRRSKKMHGAIQWTRTEAKGGPKVAPIPFVDTQIIEESVEPVNVNVGPWIHVFGTLRWGLKDNVMTEKSKVPVVRLLKEVHI
jgi:hypothetical protein